MAESIRIARSPTDMGSDLSRANPTARSTPAKTSPASLPKGGSQLENLKALGSRGAAGKAAAESARAPLTRELSFREWMPPATAPSTSKDDDWSELDDIFRRQPVAGQASIGAPAHSLIDAPQTPLSKHVSTPAPQGPAARQEPASTGSSGMLSAFKRSAKNLLGLGRSPSKTPATPTPSSTARPLRAASRPVAAPVDSVAETVAWIHEQNGRPAAWRNAIPKLSAEQARREGKAVPSRRPPPPNAANAGQVARPAAPTRAQGKLAKPTIGSGRVSKPQTKRPTKLGSLPTIPEHTHETGALASLGQHYDGLWRDLRVSIHGANSALQSLRTTPRKGLIAKRAELENHAAELKKLIAETGMAGVDLKTVQALKREAPASPNNPDALHTRAVLVDRDIHETIRQRDHARVALRRLERAIASLPPSTGR